MAIIVKNSNWSLTLSLNWLRLLGILVPGNCSGIQGVLLKIYYTFWYFYINGLYIIMQVGDLIQIWGELQYMVSTSFLLFTNLVLGLKVFNLIIRGKAILAIVDEAEAELIAEDTAEGIEIVQRCNEETSRIFYFGIFLSSLTVLLWGASAEEKGLPLRAWYPYDASKSPVYEITYFHQISAILMGAAVHVSMDTLATSLIAICRCRLGLLALSLRKLCVGIQRLENKAQLTDEQEKITLSRLTASVCRHQAALNTASEIQRCFSEPLLVQFTVSMIIICTTAYQLAVELHSPSKNVTRILSMICYLIGMVLQVFLYCYHGNQLSIENSKLATAAYECPWYDCSLRFRRALLIIMIRSSRDLQLVAGGITTLSLSCFTAIVKASYTFFTVLQQVEDRQK